MRGDLDVAAAGAWHRANPGTKMPLYLQWLQLKFVHIALRLAKSASTGSIPQSPSMIIWIRNKLAENKKQRDNIRRRLLLDRVIAINWKECEWHSQIYFPLCRSKKSEFYFYWRCLDCHWNKLDQMMQQEELAERRERAMFGTRFIGSMPSDAA